MDIDWTDPAQAIAAMGSQVGMWRWELSTDRVQWSDHLLEMLGLERSEYQEHFSFFESVLHNDDAPLVETAIQRHLATGEPYRFRCRLRHKGGAYLTTLAQGTTIRDAAGHPSEMIGTVIDVTTEVDATAQMLDSERSLRAITANVPGAIFRYVMHPDGSDEIEYMSPGCFGIWEMTADQIKGSASALWEMILDEDLPQMRDSVLASAETLVPWVARWRIRCPSGRIKHVEGRGTPNRLPDGSTQWNSLIMDRSEEAAIRAELLKREEMLGQAQKMDAIGRISGGIAHDFNNLLAIILGNAELMGELEDGRELTALRDEIIGACRRGGELTRRLLSFARQSRLAPEATDANAKIGQIGTMLARVIPESISLETVLAAGLWEVEVDPSFLETSLLNLCINARDAMPQGGKLTIETRNVRISSDYLAERTENIPPGRYVMVAVSDNGVGIPAENVKKVIEPFFTTKGPDKGTGLGLAMVEGFVRQSKGTMRIYSEVGVGTTVRIYLPALTGGATRPEADTALAQPEARAERGRVLVVEDEPAILRLLATTLSAEGYEVLTAPDGESAFRLHGPHVGQIDILLTDVVMPGSLQGPELAHKLVVLNPGLSVVFMSGYPNEAAIHGNGLRPDDLFLMKPVLRDDLLRALVQARTNREVGHG